MDTSAIHLAIRLFKHPREMNWLCQPDSALPDGVTDLLRLCSSQKQLEKFAEKHHIDKAILNKMLINFIDEVILNPLNTREKQLGVNLGDSSEKYKLHYQLLMKIYHPDKNNSHSALAKSSMISKNYQSLKSELTPLTEESNYVNVTFTNERKNSAGTRVPPKRFYQATQQAEKNISSTRNAFFAFGSATMITLTLVALYLFQQDKPQLTLNSLTEVLPIAGEVEGKAAQQVQIANVTNHEITLAKANLSNNDAPLTPIPEPLLEQLLHKLESAYEKGIVEDIKPILENAPEIRDQTDEEITAKLETLFKITRDRKMVLYNFEWQKISGIIQGKGKFLSRYLLSGEDQWLTREGIAIVTAQPEKNGLAITNLKLQNNTIEQ